MAEARPFKMIEDLYACSEKIWLSLPPGGWLQAFAASDRNNADASDGLRPLYEERFGFPFILHQDETVAGQLEAICRARLNNSPQTEILIAVHEQQKCIAANLDNLLESIGNDQPQL